MCTVCCVLCPVYFGVRGALGGSFRRHRGFNHVERMDASRCAVFFSSSAVRSASVIDGRDVRTSSSEGVEIFYFSFFFMFASSMIRRVSSKSPATCYSRVQQSRTITFFFSRQRKLSDANCVKEKV